MAGNRIGGLKARTKNKQYYGDDFYKMIGTLGGTKSRGGGFTGNPKLARQRALKGVDARLGTHRFERHMQRVNHGKAVAAMMPRDAKGHFIRKVSTPEPLIFCDGEHTALRLRAEKIKSRHYLVWQIASGVGMFLTYLIGHYSKL